MDSFYQKVVDLEKTGEAFAICSIIDSRGSTPRHEGSKMIVDQNGIVCGTVGGGEIENRTIQEAIKCLMDGKSKRLTYSLIDPEKGDVGICGGTVELYVEPILPQPKMLVIGGGHVGKAVAHLAHWLGYRVIVSDDRPEFCTKENNPDADEFCITPMEEIPGHIKINPQTYIVLTTRGMNVDVVGLPALLETNARYIGIIGSKRRWLSTRKELADQGIPEEKLNRVYSPIGLELKAETPEEIAISIMAEIIMIQNGGTGQTMKI